MNKCTITVNIFVFYIYDMIEVKVNRMVSTIVSVFGKDVWLASCSTLFGNIILSWLSERSVMGGTYGLDKLVCSFS